MNIPLRTAIAGTATITLVASLLAISTTVAAGGTSHHARASSSTITVWTMEDSTAFSTLMQNFTKQTGINVQVDAIPWANVNDKLTTAVASGNGPDVVQVGLSELPSFVGAGALLNLNSYAKHDTALQNSNYPVGVSAKKLNPPGKMLSVPWISDVRVLFYRSDILAQAGITRPPTTWTQLHADAAKLATRGTNQYGFYIPQWDSALPVEFTWQAGGSITDKKGNVTFNTPAFNAAANFYLSFYQDKLVPTASDFDQTQGFVSGAAPMLISGPYLAASIKSAAPDLAGKWNVAPLPKDRTGMSLFAGSNMGVWYKSKKVAASVRLLDYLAKPATQLSWFKATGDLPTAKAALANPSLNADPMVRVYSKQLQLARLLPPLVPQWNQISTALLNALNSIVLNGVDKQTALNQLNQTVAALQK
jgi:multiple sugar transport system substrate-binding protein